MLRTMTMTTTTKMTVKKTETTVKAMKRMKSRILSLISVLVYATSHSNSLHPYYSAISMMNRFCIEITNHFRALKQVHVLWHVVSEVGYPAKSTIFDTGPLDDVENGSRIVDLQCFA